jgi:glycosyltransferase involved in cell wall biosynthesis
MEYKTIFNEWPMQKPLTKTIGDIDTNFPKISIITPCYNQGEFIEETILSVINQEYPNVQFIIIDGGSTDDTISIIKKYENSIDYWISEKDNGQSNAINKGLLIADGEIINWLCSDDLLLPGALHYIAKTFMLNPDISVVAGIARKFSEKENIGLSTTTLYKEFHILINNSHICQPATWFKKKIFDSLTPLNENLHYTMDSEIWLKYLLQYGTKSIIYLPQVLCGYRYHNKSKSVSQDIQFYGDKIGLIYSVLYILNAPPILLKIYKPFCKSKMHESIHYPKWLTKEEIKNIINLYNIKAITLCKLQGNYIKFFHVTLFYIFNNPIKPIGEYFKLLRNTIAPKFFGK